MKPNFNKVVSYYDDNAVVQRKIGLQMIQMIKETPTNILDIGCGTGYLTNNLKNIYPNANIMGIDISTNMISYAKSLYNNIKFIEMDFESLKLDKKFDLIYSNMAFQWSYNLKQVFQDIHKYIAKNGILLFSIPLKGSFKNLPQSFVMDLPDHNLVLDYLQTSGYEIYDFTYVEEILKFDSIASAIKHIKSTGASCNIKSQKNLSLLRSIYNNPIELNYKIGIYTACK